MANQRRSKRNKKSDHTKLVPKVPNLEPNGKRKAVQQKKGEEGAHKETDRCRPATGCSGRD
jgi:hypothetical protein